MSRTSAAGAAKDERWVADVSCQLVEGLRQRIEAFRAAGGDPASLGSPDELADRMLAVVPTRSAWNALGPFYTTRSVASILGGVSRQAVEDRRRRRRILAIRTDDGVWLYPAFQFDADNRVLRGLTDVLAVLAGSGLSEWTVASALVAAQPDLGGRSIVEHLRAGGPLEPVLDLCRATAAAASR